MNSNWFEFVRLIAATKLAKALLSHRVYCSGNMSLRQNINEPMRGRHISLYNTFKMATDHGIDKQSEQSDSSPSTWNVTTSKMLIQFYKENTILWVKNHKDYGEKDTPKEDAHPCGCKAGLIHGAKKRRRNKETMA